jgi:hypothetical protein
MDEQTTPYLVLAALATFAGPALTQAGKVWRWVDNFSTLVNGGLGLLFAIACWLVFDPSLDRGVLGGLIMVGLGGSQVGAMGYTVAKRATQVRRAAPRPSGRELPR